MFMNAIVGLILLVLPGGAAFCSPILRKAHCSALTSTRARLGGTDEPEEGVRWWFGTLLP